MPIAHVNGAAIRYRLDGPPEAPAVVLCNSLGSDLRMWDRVMPALGGHRVLRLDARGHGGSPATPGPYTVELLAGDALGVIEQVGLRHPHVCGLSLGGMVAMRLAASAPGTVASLVLCNTAARIARPEVYQERMERVRSGGLAPVVDAVLSVWFTARFRAERPEVVALAREMILACSPEGYAAACAAVRDHHAHAWLGRITARTLVVVGAEDPATPPADGRFLAEHIPGARYVELPVAHLSALEAGPTLGERIASFLAGDVQHASAGPAG
jgi:3-oxoadipate enol-lactonase